MPQAFRQQVTFPSGPASAVFKDGASRAAAAAGQKVNLGKLAQTAIMDQFAPTAVLIDAGNLAPLDKNRDYLIRRTIIRSNIDQPYRILLSFAKG